VKASVYSTSQHVPPSCSPCYRVVYIDLIDLFKPFFHLFFLFPFSSTISSTIVHLYIHIEAKMVFTKKITHKFDCLKQEHGNTQLVKWIVFIWLSCHDRSGSAWSRTRGVIATVRRRILLLLRNNIPSITTIMRNSEPSMTITVIYSITLKDFSGEGQI